MGLTTRCWRPCEPPLGAAVDASQGNGIPSRSLDASPCRLRARTGEQLVCRPTAMLLDTGRVRRLTKIPALSAAQRDATPATTTAGFRSVGAPATRSYVRAAVILQVMRCAGKIGPTTDLASGQASQAHPGRPRALLTRGSWDAAHHRLAFPSLHAPVCGPQIQRLILRHTGPKRPPSC